MIIGNGLIAKKFNIIDNNNVIIFASGVSNSNETRVFQFNREKELLLNTIITNQNKTIVYFSSCDVMYKDKLCKPYYFHKFEMESLIKENTLRYYIFRLPQLIGYSANKNSLINYFVNSIIEEKKINIWKNAYKNLIDIDDIHQIVEYTINNEASNTIINIINKNYYSILDIVMVLQDLFKIKANIKIISKGFKPCYRYNNIADKLGIIFDEGYLKKSLLKHYEKFLATPENERVGKNSRNHRRCGGSPGRTRALRERTSSSTRCSARPRRARRRARSPGCDRTTPGPRMPERRPDRGRWPSCSSRWRAAHPLE